MRSGPLQRARHAVMAIPQLPWALARLAWWPVARVVCIFSSLTAPQRTPYGNPLPTKIHVTLNSREMKSGRVIIVGDVHGCLAELRELLDQVSYSASEDNLILVGDLVNKGPDSLGVLRLVKALGPHVVRGNHDDSLLARWRAWRQRPNKVYLKDVYQWSKVMTEEESKVLDQLPFSLWLPEWGLVVVHAGVVPPGPAQAATLAAATADAPASTNPSPRPAPSPASPSRAPGSPSAAAARQQGVTQSVTDLLSHQDLNNLINMRNVKAEDKTPHQPGHSVWVGLSSQDEGVPWANTWQGPQHVFFGHDARRRLQLAPHCTGLDTGCCYGGSLTAAVIPPLSQLLATCPAVAAHAQSVLGESLADLPTLTREDLQVQLVSVAAHRAYEMVRSGTG